METPESKKPGELSVSRSGRIRKKSSKLMDFQSPDDIETKLKKKEAKQQKHANNSSHITGAVQQQIGNNNNQQVEGTLTDENYLTGDGVNDESFDSDDIDIADADLEDINDDGDVNDEDEDVNDNGLDPTVRKSIYMTEKINKKKVLKDGKIVFSKTQRKDKGKTRFTAYMLWAKDVRKKMQTKKPEMDFAATSRRLSEMWANVPTNEKQKWRHRAKKIAARGTKKQPKTNLENQKSPTKFLNKNTNNTTSSTGKGRKASQPQSENQQSKQQKVTHVLDLVTPQSHNLKTSPIVTPGIYKVTGTDAVDIAAHLKLLGDSLIIIGERLKEHEGQITVSGSLSVLLDSMLCSMGPLMCLTSYISDSTKNDANLNELLKNTLDNIAYVMPGL